MPPDDRSSKYMKPKQTELKGEICFYIIAISIITVRDFNTTLTIKDRTKEKIWKESEDLNNTFL